jgi:UDP-glucose:(heptosyl)LPS alpha-1,3-glucosyltransferase
VRIALNIETIGARRGGAEKYAGTLCRCLAAAGHEVHVFAREVDAGELPAEVRIHLVRPRGFPGLGFLRAYQFAQASEAALRGEPLDLIIGFVKVWYQHVYVAVGGSHIATLVYNSRRQRGWLGRAAWWLGKAVSLKQWTFQAISRKQFGARYAPHVIAPSRMVAQHFQHYHHIPGERISVVYNLLDSQLALDDSGAARAAFRREHGLGGDEVAVLFAARNYSMKGLRPLLEAFARVAADCPRARLVVCGSGRDGGYRRLAASLGIARQVLFLGFVDDARPSFAGCDVFAFPTFYDPCSLVVLEAMGAGLPVITTRQNGAGELLSEGQDGYVIDSPWAVEQLAARLWLLLTDDDLRRRMGARARANVERFTIRAGREELLAALERAAADPQASPRLRSAA